MRGDIDSTNTDVARRLTEIVSEAQCIDCSTVVHGNRLEFDQFSEISEVLRNTLKSAGASEQFGLDPSVFEINREVRPIPFPGLSSFGDSDADAAIFYGRSRETAQALDELRKQRASGDRRPLIVLGASGSGKSSLLKAGIIPRLRREGDSWIPLRAMRCLPNGLERFSHAVSATYLDYGLETSGAEIYDRLIAVWRKTRTISRPGSSALEGVALENALEFEGSRLRSVANRPHATILISVDQAEELTRGDAEGCDALADYLRAALQSNRSRWSLAFTVRTDSFPELQQHKRFQSIEARGYDLRSIPTYRLGDVIELPAKRYGVEIDGRLVDQMLEDAPASGGMPLLAFAMQRLWNAHANSGKIDLKHYESHRGLAGLLDDAAERAMQHASFGSYPHVAPEKANFIDVAREAFVPALVGIDGSGTAVRRIASWSEFGLEQQAVLKRFEDWYLISILETGSGDKTVEVVHEALFENWRRFRQWLEPERANLESIRLLKAASFLWSRHNRSVAYLDHRRGARLQEVLALRQNPRYESRLTNDDLSYLSACKTEAEKEATNKKRATAVLVLLLIILGLGGAGWIEQQWVRQQWKMYATIRPFFAKNIRPYVLSAEMETNLSAGDEFRECAANAGCPVMVVVPAGITMLGSNNGRENERPVHKVDIQKFAIGKFEVTFEEWDTCVAYGWCTRNADKFGRGRQPVINVSWYDAVEYTRWLSAASGKRYRLVSEAEWEYAARGSRDTNFYWGDELGKGNANCGVCGNDFDNKRTVKVGSFTPNSFGLHDMNGNVWEWCADVAEPDYNGAPPDGSPRLGEESALRVLRGGGWNSTATNLRSSARYAAPPFGRHDDYGFRIARTLSSQ
jgi:formylglycine-generating enzyme required for sulfatase activity